MKEKKKKVLYRIIGWMAMKLGWMRAKALGVGTDGETQGVGAREQRGIAKEKIETGCVLVFAQ